MKLEVGAELIWPVIAAATRWGAASICGAATSCCGACSVIICLGAALGKLLESRAATAAAAAAAADLGLPAGLGPPTLGCTPSALVCAWAISAAISGVIMRAARLSGTTPQE